MWFYFTLFMVPGVITGYGGIWFAYRGLNEAQIGVLNAAPIFVLFLINVFVGRLSDRATDWKMTIVLGSFIGSIALFLLIFADNYVMIFLSITGMAVAGGAVIPVIDAAAMRLAKRTGANFGAQRSWGTVGYLITLVLTGVLTTHFGPDAFVWLMIGFGVWRACAAITLPRFRTPTDTPASTHLGNLKSVLKAWFLLPLIGFAIVNSSHLLLNAFQSLMLSRQGFNPTTIGILIALGAVSETIVFIGYARLAKYLSARAMIAISAAMAILRWTAFAFEPNIWGLVPLQLMHGITYGLGFMSTVTFISNWVSEENAAESQGFSVMLQQVAIIIAVPSFGPLIAMFGAKAYFFSALYASTGLACVLISLRLKPPLQSTEQT